MLALTALSSRFSERAIARVAATTPQRRIFIRALWL